MKKNKEIVIQLDQVMIDGAQYTIEVNSDNEVLTEEAMIIPSQGRIIINEYKNIEKSEWTKMMDLFHEITHGIINHRLSNFHLISRATSEEEERLVQEMSTGFLNLIKDNPELIAAIYTICQKKLKT